MRAILLLVLAAASVLACACDDDSSTPDASTTPEEAATARRPTSTPQPSPTPRSSPLPEPRAEEIALIERVIALVRAGDEAGLKQLASGRFSPCEAQHSGPGGGPQCLESEAVGTPVESIGESICDGAPARLEDVQFLIEERDEPLEVAAYRPRIAGADAQFFDVRFSGRFNMTLTVSNGRIGNIGRGCSTQAPLVLGGRVAQWVIPPPYQPFAAVGIVVRPLAEPGVGGPFIWRFPQDRESGAGDYRVYGVSVAPASGERVCVYGWLDDVGNVEAREVGAEPCTRPHIDTGIAIVDQTIAAVYAQDVSRFIDLIGFQQVACAAEASSRVGSPPTCVEDEPVGTQVEAFSLGVCDQPTYHQRVQAHALLSEVFQPLELYAAHSSDGGGLWIYFQSPRDGRVVTVIAGESIDSIHQTCDRVTGEMMLGSSAGFIIPPQY